MNKTDVYDKTEADNRYLKLSGGTMSGELAFKNNALDVTTTSGYQGTNINIFDKNNNRVGMFRASHRDTTNEVEMHVFGKTNNAKGNIGIYSSNDGNAYTFAPTPAANDNSTKIATTAWVNTNSVKKSGDTLVGDRPFIGGQGTNKRLELVGGNALASGGSIQLFGKDYNEAGYTGAVRFFSTDGTNTSTMMLKPSGETYCPTPATTDNSTKIATTAFVNNFVSSNAPKIIPVNTNNAWSGDTVTFAITATNRTMYRFSCLNLNSDGCEYLVIVRVDNTIKLYKVDNGSITATFSYNNGILTVKMSVVSFWTVSLTRIANY